MDKASTKFPEKQTWGTWEELVLACAVHRYGTDNWTSVAAQVQKRSSTLKCLTPRSCLDKYHDLNRRFANYDSVSLTDKPDIPWLDELKKLRVAELKREVEHYNLSIVSLQLKVKKLTEEQEQNSKVKETQYLDPEKTLETNGDQDNKNDKNNSISDEESDRDNRSVNESNSTNPKGEDTEKGPEPEEPAALKTENAGEDIKTAKEDSCNGSCGSAAKESARNSERVDSPELRESVAESRDGGEEGHGKERESSDVQSSASLSRKEEKANEPDNEGNQLLPIKCVSVESQPLVECLEIIRSHKLGSIFERRLDIQETPDYVNIVRQHIDLETVRLRLEEHWYSSCYSSFFRDLLLVFNNAIVFFGKNSSESLSAIELRQVVLKEMALKSSNSNQLWKEKCSVSSAAQNVKLDTESSDSLFLKSNISLPLIACRKRSSITARGAASSSGADKKIEQTASLIDKKPVLDWKKHDKSSVKTDHEHVSKKRTRERSASGTRSSSKNAKRRTNIKTKKNEDANTSVDHSIEIGFTDDENSEAKPERDGENNTNANAKKRSAANFLSRITRSSPTKKGTLLETLKNPVISSDNSRKGAEQKKNSNCKSDSRKDQNLHGKRAKEKESLVKRTKGRLPRKAAAPLPPVSAARGKRGREGGEMEASAPGRARKRSRNR